jgi:hypothetical protein
MRKLVLSLTVLVFLSAAISGSLWAQGIKFPSVSQKASISQTVGLVDITITYHRPGVKGRVIWGKLVPFDKNWRTGANNATTIEFSGDVTIAGTKVAAGKYAIFTIPGKTEWTIIVSKQADLIGNAGYKESEDMLRVKVKPMEAPHCEWMRFGFDKLTDSSAFVYLHWEKLMVGFDVKVDTEGTVMKSIESTLGRYWVAPYRAANYAFGKEMLDKAKEWISQSTSLKKVYWNVLLKAKIYDKLAKDKKDKKKVIKILEMAISLIPELPEGQRSFATEAEKMLKELKGKK